MHVYRNLHRKCWSLRERGKVVDHADRLVLTGVTAHVQPGGRARSQKEGTKNVHAYLKGKPSFTSAVDVSEVLEHGRRISYSPFGAPTFVYSDDGTPFSGSDTVVLTEHGAFVIVS